jgi:hypothetical protein
MTRVFGANHHSAVVEIRQCSGGVQPLNVRLIVDALFEHHMDELRKERPSMLPLTFTNLRVPKNSKEAVTAPSR